MYTGIIHLKGHSGKILCNTRRAIMATPFATYKPVKGERVCEKCIARLSPEGKAKIAAMSCEA